MTRKSILKATAVIMLLLIFFILFLAYRSNKSYHDVIHKDAKSIIKINVDGIYKSIVLNFFQNPGYYLGKNHKKTRNEEVKNGLSFPANIFLFTVNGLAQDTFFGSLPLANIHDFKSYVKSNWDIAVFSNKDGLLIGKNQNQKITIAIFKNRIAFSYSNRNEDTYTILKDLLTRKNTMVTDNNIINKLKNNTAHLFYFYEDTELFGNFNEGNISLIGSLPIAKQDQPEIKFNTESAIQFYLPAPIFNFGRSNVYQIDNYSLNLDSIFKYHTGPSSFELIKTVKQNDTIITYDYNDNFEKEEQVTVKTVIVPEMIVNLNGDGIGLANYLKHAGLIDKNNIFNRKVFPLYTVYSSFNHQNFSLSTFKKTEQQSLQKTKDQFYLKIDFKKLRQFKNLQLINRYFHSLQKLEVKIDNNSKLSGLIQFREPNINALLQMR